ncbi:MAG: 30S ribosomal protein S1 [Gammaproteobacteria bacterium]|nr:30S ribosomal protein S1 [Gammaproteobacteria bacterium]
MTESFAQMFEENYQTLEMVPGSIITGTVVDIDNDDVTINVGLKSEGVVPKTQFLNPDGTFTLSIGDDVKVAMEIVDDGNGETRVSREKAKRKETWDKLEAAHTDQEIVTGMISGKVKGGFTVDVDDIRAFLPGSLVDIRPTRDISNLEGQELEFQVIKLDQSRNNVVLSRRAVLESEFSEEKEQLIRELAEGQVKQGYVKNLTDYGAFVDLGGVDGLLHVTDMAWKRIRHPSEKVEVGDEVTVKVLAFDPETLRVSLGLKQLEADPWIDITDRYPPQTRVEASVTNITDYGCFAEIEPGIEGLVHVSEMDWVQRNVIPSKVVTLGEKIEVMILDIDEAKRRISLGIKQCKENPWFAFSRNHLEGDRVRGTVKAVMDFGVFISLEGNVDGLVHLPDLHWSEDPNVSVKRYSKGQEVEAVILQIDAEKERIGLGIKQLDGDPLADYLAEHRRDSVVTGEVIAAEQNFAIVKLAEDVDGTLRIGEVSNERIEDVRHILKIGDKVEAKIVNVDGRTRAISLSIRAKEQQAEKEAHLEYQRRTEEASAGAVTLGDLVKSQLEKSSREEEEAGT